MGYLLGMLVLSTLAAAVAAGARLLIATARRAEAEDTAQLAIEALAFDVRRAGFDPRGTVAAYLVDAAPDRFAIHADLDADGTIDSTSEEATRYRCDVGAGRLSRIVGRQSLPLADGVQRCTFAYLDASGRLIPAPTAGLAPIDLVRVTGVELVIALQPSAGMEAVSRTARIALRRTS